MAAPRSRFDPDFAAVADLTGYHVFLTAYDIDFPLSVKMRTTTGFAVRANPALARAAGVSENDLSGTFSWRIVAKRKDILIRSTQASHSARETHAPRGGTRETSR